jgi:hypothetical protein
MEEIRNRSNTTRNLAICGGFELPRHHIATVDETLQILASAQDIATVL